jgi:hypothetical protein
VGELEAPTSLQLPEPLTAKEAEAMSAKHQERFEAIAETKGLKPAQAWKQLEQHCNGLTAGQKDLLRNVLSGWHVWDPGEWEAICANGNDPVDVALAAWDKAVDD